jgi:iron complex outermembrane receptor protein
VIFPKSEIQQLKHTLLGMILTWPVSINALENEFESTFGDVETVSIATGREQPIQTSPAIASVITAEDIRQTGARNLEDILKQVPGFHIGESIFQLDPVLAVRGFTSAFNQATLIMLDGVPQTQLFFGDRRITLGTIPLDMIDRVEIIRGPGSALYGADAFSAVVNVITKNGVPDQSQVTLSVGSDNTFNVRAITGKKFGDIEVIAAAEYLETDGYEPFITTDQQTLLDADFGTQASLAPGKANTHRKEFGAQLKITGDQYSLGIRTSQWRDIGMGIGAGSALDPFGSTDNTTWEATFNYRDNISKNWIIDGFIDGLLFNYQVNDWNFFPPGAFGIFSEGVVLNGELDERFLRLQGSLEYTGFNRHYWKIGAGGELSELEIQSNDPNYILIDGLPIPRTAAIIDTPSLDGDQISRDLFFAYIQNEWIFHTNWVLTWGIRYDHYSDFGGTINPRAVIVWNARHNLTMKLLYGRGFRAPSILETRDTDIPAINANPNLNPEILNNIELAFDYKPLLDVQLRLNFFYQETDEQIRLQNTGGADFSPENVGNQEGLGFEVEAAWEITPNTRLYVFYAYQENTDETTNEDAGYSPHHKILARLQHQYGQWFFNLQSLHIGDRDRIAEDSRPEADTYTLVDLLTRYEFSQFLEASLDIRNLFDESANEAGVGTSFPGDIPLPDRTFYLSLGARF